MAKMFTNKPINRLDQVKTNNITTNLDKYLDELNGDLDSNNLPVKSINQDKLRNPNVPLADITGPIVKESASMPTQAYYRSRRSYNEDGGASDIYDPVLEVDLEADSWSAGFNRLSHLDSGFNNFPLQFDAKEGMLTGCAVIDWEHGNQVYAVPRNGANPPIGRGNDWWTEWAVFVNNVLVARTGFIYPRRHTTQLPFSVACGSQPVQIDVRCRINTWFVTNSPAAAGDYIPTDFVVFSAELWCRNQYR